ncbi:MFS transporter [Phytomonospora endophytica]|uniref:MFS family permease n=1 Tax=Phytomonospora endophytica TaxID=714109 RepID=A0A841FY57_9ACTN|nr:MFS transporter [Phytomonospora endophytica]MBB6036900.1 MFS family permease [Phytomonospora endophytica]GIG68068.1 hypothetical protein Pen01_43630 [Phytomonospora endophytica]
MTPPASPDASTRRERRAMYAASLFNGPAELLDFVLPLWAGLTLNASAAQVGMLMAVEMAASVLMRPLAGVLADRVERRVLAGIGALVYAVSCVGYALAGSVTAAAVAAVLGGLGGAVFWVALRAMVAERLPRDPAVFPKLLSAEETGSWIAFVAAMSTLSMIGFRSVFLACAVACVAAAVALFSGPSRVEPLAPTAPGGIAALSRRLWPMLLAVVTTMIAEAAVALLLLLRLQRDFDLGVQQIALVFLPGAIAISALPQYLHRFTVRFGRRAVLAAASLLSATFAASLAWAPNPWVIGALWILAGAAWAAVIPIQQAVIAEASGGARVGRGMGLYESACLVGAMLGGLAAGLLFDGPGWIAACLVSAAVIACGAVLMPFAVGRLGVADRPTPPEREPDLV